MKRRTALKLAGGAAVAAAAGELALPGADLYLGIDKVGGVDPATGPEFTAMLVRAPSRLSARLFRDARDARAWLFVEAKEGAALEIPPGPWARIEVFCESLADPREAITITSGEASTIVRQVE